MCEGILLVCLSVCSHVSATSIVVYVGFPNGVHTTRAVCDHCNLFGFCWEKSILISLTFIIRS